MTRTVRPRRAVLPMVFVCLAIGALIGSHPLLAQSLPDQVPKIDTDLIIVPLVVEDRMGHRVPGLVLKDFVLSDNGRFVQPDFFSAGDENVATVFALDDSRSVRDLLAQQHAAALSLLQRFGPRTETAVMRFGREPRLALPFTSNQEGVQTEFTRIDAQDEHTAIFDAALAAVKLLAPRGNRRLERRIVILLSDGLDTASRVKPGEVIDAARADGVSFYVIQLPLYTVRGDEIVTRPVSKGFRELAGQTGGLFLAAPKAKEAWARPVALNLGPLFRAIADDLNGQYMLAYYLNHDLNQTGLHHPEVKLDGAGRKGLNVRLLRGDFTVQP